MLELELTDELQENLLEYMETRGYAIGTIKNYKAHLKVLFKGNKTLDKEYLLKILKKYSLPYQRSLLSLINEYCFFSSIDFKMIIPRQIKKPRKIPETLSIEEIQRMISVTAYPWNLFLRTVFGFGAGLRISEVIRLSWHRFNWATWLSDKDKNGLYEVFATKRGKNFYVTVPKKLMEDYYVLAKEKNQLNEFGIPESGVIFDFGIDSFKQDIKQLNIELWKFEYVKHSYNWVRYNLLQKVCNKAIGKKIHIHMLRHSRATYLLEQGIPLEEISKLLGHSDLRTSLIYAKVNMKKVMEKMEKIESI